MLKKLMVLVFLIECAQFVEAAEKRYVVVNNCQPRSTQTFVVVGNRSVNASPVIQNAPGLTETPPGYGSAPQGFEWVKDARGTSGWGLRQVGTNPIPTNQVGIPVRLVPTVTCVNGKCTLQR